MPLIVESLRSQTLPVKIWLINNLDDKSFGADRLISIPWNAGEWARYVFAPRIETAFGMFQDDDFLIADRRFLEDAMAVYDLRCRQYKGTEHSMLGVSGRGFQKEPPHYHPDYPGGQDAYVHILKGHFQLWHRDVTRRLPMPNHPSASDIYWSIDIGLAQPWHWIDSGLYGRMKQLPRYDVGYEFRPNHYQEREQVCEEIARRLL